jgi:hypothetical protein
LVVECWLARGQYLFDNAGQAGRGNLSGTRSNLGYFVGEGGTVSDKNVGGVWTGKDIRVLLDELADMRIREEAYKQRQLADMQRIYDLEKQVEELGELVEVAEEAVELERSIFSLPDNGTTVVLRDGWTGKPIVGKVVDFSSFAR